VLWRISVKILAVSIELILLEDLLIVVESDGDEDLDPGGDGERPWSRPREGPPPFEAVCPAVDAGAIGEAQFADWMRLRVATA
jgi:hypothetical protein